MYDFETEEKPEQYETTERETTVAWGSAAVIFIKEKEI